MLLIEKIVEKTERMRLAVEQTSRSTQNYISIMDGAVASMEQIEGSTQDTLQTIQILEQQTNEIGSLQESSQTVVEDISIACEDSGRYVSQVVDMAENMTQLMCHSADMIQEIKDNLLEQENLISDINHIFETVNQVSVHLQETVER